MEDYIIIIGKSVVCTICQSPCVSHDEGQIRIIVNKECLDLKVWWSVGKTSLIHSSELGKVFTRNRDLFVIVIRPLITDYLLKII